MSSLYQLVETKVRIMQLWVAWEVLYLIAPEPCCAHRDLLADPGPSHSQREGGYLLPPLLTERGQLQ